MTSDETLNQAIVALKAGRKAESRQLLAQILQRDSSNETAWLWLSGAAETKTERLACLERVLAINPDNEIAQRGLAHLRIPTPPSHSDSIAQAQTPQAATARSALSTAPASPSTPQTSTTSAAMRPAATPAFGQAIAGGVGLERMNPRQTLPQVAGPRDKSTVDQILKVVLGLSIAAVAAIFGYMIMSLALDNLSDPVGEQGAQASVWKEFVSQEGQYSVWMPGKPKSETQPVSTPVGVIQLHLVALDTPDMAFIVGYSDYPEYLVRSGDPDQMLSGARDGAVANVGGKLIGERQIRYQGYPGREIWIEAPIEDQIGLAHARVVLVGARLYQVLAAGPKTGFPSNTAEQFLNSFVLLR
jgi:hypothetical protein